MKVSLDFTLTLSLLLTETGGTDHGHTRPRRLQNDIGLMSGVFYQTRSERDNSAILLPMYTNHHYA